MNHLTPKPPSLWMQSSRRCEATATNWKSSQPHNPALHFWRVRAVTAAPTVSLDREMSAQHITIRHHSLTFLTTITQPPPTPPHPNWNTHIQTHKHGNQVGQMINTPVKQWGSLFDLHLICLMHNEAGAKRGKGSWLQTTTTSFMPFFHNRSVCCRHICVALTLVVLESSLSQPHHNDASETLVTDSKCAKYARISLIDGHKKWTDESALILFIWSTRV